MRRLSPGALLFLLSALAAAQAPYESWRTIETPHYRVHYPVAFEDWARHAAASIESIHRGVTDFVGYTPPKRIEMVIGDPEADANGAAFPFLDRAVVVLWAYPPESESGLGDYTDWMELVVTHEVAHIAHLTRPRNRARLLSRLLPLPIGPLALTSPRWVAEGYATLVEGALTGSGRPNSSFRAMVLRRFAVEGKLPSYGVLSSSGGWLEGSMAYLVGSSYLEWLERREGEDALRKLWKRMASRRGGGFAASFRSVFGESPSDLYDRFRAEVTAHAIEEEKRIREAGLVEGEKWQRLTGATSSPQVSPDGKRLLAWRASRPGRERLAVWSIEPTDAERRADVREREAEARLARDPNEVVDKPEVPRPRAPDRMLPRWNGSAPENPRWMPDGRRVLFSRRVPDPEGVRHRDLFLWDVETGRVARATRLADLAEADPAPGGAWAAGVRNRHGRSELVRIDLATGDARPIETGSAAAAETDWRVWSHPRVSPDGGTIAALLHQEGAWRLVAVPAQGGAPRVLADSAVGPPAWSADGSTVYFGSDATGVWEIASVGAASAADSKFALERPGGARTLTRVTGGAFSPAPSPDGGSLFFLSVTAKGVDLRRLALPAEPIESAPRSEAASPVLPPVSRKSESFALAEIGASHPYRAFETHVVRLASGFTAGPSGNSWQAGAEGTDVVGRLDWVALGAFGNAAGPRGGSVAAAWSGLPVKFSLHLFSSLERPGSQRLAKRPELDEQRWGLFAGGSWRRPFDGGRVEAELGGGWTRVETFRPDERFSRALGSARLSGTLRRTRGRAGFALGVDLDGSAGETSGAVWRQFAVRGRIEGISAFATLGISARYGDTGGSPTRFDLFRIGGAASSIQPPGLDRNRIESPALPAALQVGGRLETWRAEIALRALPLVVYAERLRAWDAGAERPPAVRVSGVELRLERLVPLEIPQQFSLYVGAARVKSDQPRLRTTQGYGGLVYRP